MFRVLVVCTGNICRSPMAEHLLREGLRSRLGSEADTFVVVSAGTFGLTDNAMESFAADTLRDQHGIDGTAFRAKALADFMVTGADLVLTATRDHRAAAVTLQPQAARKTFTIREFDRLLSVVDPATLPTGDREARAHALVAAAASQRGLVRPDKPSDDDVTDPYRGPLAGYVSCAALLHGALQRPLDLLAG
ncbi:MAG: Tyrosine phosphatase [Frankiales bacterium]|nr:Tyrosine phosphatase [Frankiales bacterium]